jgi:hypothetical protein
MAQEKPIILLFTIFKTVDQLAIKYSHKRIIEITQFVTVFILFIEGTNNHIISLFNRIKLDQNLLSEDNGSTEENNAERSGIILII